MQKYEIQFFTTYYSTNFVHFAKYLHLYYPPLQSRIYVIIVFNTIKKKSLHP